MKNKYEIRGDVTAIFIYGEGEHRETIVSTDKLDFIQTLDVMVFYSAGYACFKYPLENGKQRSMNLHRFITNAPAGMEVDHINHNKLDNTNINLRVVTKSINQQNRRNPDNVALDKRSNNYYAYVTANKKRYYSRYFKTYSEAKNESFKMRCALMPGSSQSIDSLITEKQIELQGKEKPRGNNKTSGIRYISFQSRINKWRVKIKTIRYGDFNTLEEAEKVKNEILDRMKGVN
jgi:hypothetical protein